MKALFVIHCQDPIYGASRSVGNLIRNLDADIDIIFPVKIRNDDITQKQIDRFYGSRVRHVWFLPQPERITSIVERVRPIQFVKALAKEVLYRLCKRRYENILYEGEYDFIHLNSIVLFPMLDSKWPMFLHVREAVRQKQHFWNRNLTKKLNQAHGVFFIDPGSKNCAPKLRVPTKMLINPIDQRNVGTVDVSVARRKFCIDEAETIYGIIGNVSENKGVDFAIRAFQKADIPNSVFLVVGSLDSLSNDPIYISTIKKIAEEDRRIRLVGEVQDVEQVYCILDYVVRADRVAGFGRTVYEALYSGCGAIVQDDGQLKHEKPNMTDEMHDRIYFYQIRDEKSMVKAYLATGGKKIINRRYCSNIDGYVKEFTSFVKENAQ